MKKHRYFEISADGGETFTKQWLTDEEAKEEQKAGYTVTPPPFVYTSFIDDREKIDDLLHLSQEEFLQSYSYLTPEEYALTIIDIMARLFPEEEAAQK